MTDKQKIGWCCVVAVTALTLVGFWLRYRCLGCLGFRGDEDLTALAIRALSSKGVPELPSGMIYLRFYPYQQLLSLSVNWLGFSEYSLRLPGVILGTTLIPAAYYVASKLTDRKIALIVVLGIALSYWQIDVSRTARMYAPFFLIYLAAAFTIYQHHYVDRDRLWSPLAIILCMIALSLHQLAYSLAVFFLLAIPLQPNSRRAAALITQSGLVAIGFLLFKKVQDHFFYRAKELANAAQSGAVDRGEDSGIISMLLDQISLPDLTLLLQTLQLSTVGAILFTGITIGLLAWCWRGASELAPATKTLGVFAVLFAAAHQFNLNLIMLALMIVVNRNGLTTLRDAAWLRFLIASTTLFILWVTVVFAIAKFFPAQLDVADIGVRKLLRLLVDYPNFRLFWSFVLERPLLAIPLALGTLWCIGKSARPNLHPIAIFLAGGFWAVLFVNGVLKTKFEFFRYNLHMDVFYITLVAIGIVKLPEILTSLGWSTTAWAHRKTVGWPWFAIAGVLVFVGVRPVAAYLTTSRDYYEASRIYQLSGLGQHPDFRSPAMYVRDRLSREDRIFVFEPREYWNYIGRVDYWIYSDNYQSQSYFGGHRFRDLYLGVPVLTTLSEFRQELFASNSGDVWILYSKSRLSKTPWITEEIKSYIATLDENIVYTGEDRATVVIRLQKSDKDAHL